jgi:hypothetical protein
MQPKPERSVVVEYLTTIEAAAYVKLSRQFLEGARHRGDGSGPAYIKLDRAVRYRRDALDAWMAAHHHAAGRPLSQNVLDSRLREAL